MKKIELLKVSSNLLKVMSENGIKASDVMFIEVYDEFQKKRKQMKFSAAVSELAEKHNKSERTISRKIAEMQEEVKL